MLWITVDNGTLLWVVYTRCPPQKVRLSFESSSLRTDRSPMEGSDPNRQSWMGLRGTGPKEQEDLLLFRQQCHRAPASLLGPAAVCSSTDSWPARKAMLKKPLPGVTFPNPALQMQPEL